MNNHKTRITRLLAGIFVGWLALSLTLNAAQEDSTTANENNSGNEQEAQSAETNATDGTDTVEALPDIGLIEEAEPPPADDENFIPSVQITEDLPVAFPVDI